MFAKQFLVDEAQMNLFRRIGGNVLDVSRDLKDAARSL